MDGGGGGAGTVYIAPLYLVPAGPDRRVGPAWVVRQRRVRVCKRDVEEEWTGGVGLCSRGVDELGCALDVEAGPWEEGR